MHCGSHEGCSAIACFYKIISFVTTWPIAGSCESTEVILHGKGNRYERLWYNDGLREHVAAIFLY